MKNPVISQGDFLTIVNYPNPLIPLKKVEHFSPDDLKAKGFLVAV